MKSSAARAPLVAVALGAALVALVASAAAAPARAAARATRKAVEAQLRAYEPPASPARWSSLGNGVDEVLVEVGRDPKVEALIRARAVSALGYFPTPAARRFLEQTVDGKAASKDPGDRLLLRKAAVALGWLGGLNVPGRLAPLLDHPDPDVRLDAALALGLTRLAAAADPLRRRLETEPDDRVRVQIGRQLRIIEGSGAPGR